MTADDLEGMDWTYLEHDMPDCDEEALPGIFDSALGYRLASLLPGKERRGLPNEGIGDLMQSAPQLVMLAVNVYRFTRAVAAGLSLAELADRCEDLEEEAAQALEAAGVEVPDVP